MKLSTPSNGDHVNAEQLKRSASAVFPPALQNAMNGLSKREGVSPFMTLLAAFQTLLHRYAHQDDISIEATVGRSERLEAALIRGNLAGDPTFRAVLARLSEVAGAKFAQQGRPLHAVFKVSDVAAISAALGRATVSAQPVEAGKVKSGLLMKVDESGAGLTFSVEYAPQWFDRPTILRMLGHYRALLEGIVANPDERIVVLPLLTSEERKQILVKWNATTVDYPKDVCLHELFEAQVKRTPDVAAVVFEDQQLTYRELNERANQLAHHLRSMGVGTETFVAICMERSLEMVVGIYGTMKAGAAYVPIDPTYPQDRLEFMLQDANAPVLLTQEKLLPKLPPHQAKVVCVDSNWAVIAREITTAPKTDVAPSNLAYMIYTSGSTGKPKGAMNTHRGICNRLLWMQDAYRLTADDRVMQKTPFSFDVSVWEFFWPLLTGARLIVARPEGHRDSAYLMELIKAQQITTLHFVPSMLQVFLREPGVENCRTLRRVICSGEALSYELQELFFSCLPDTELHNLYGPTEAAVDVTYWACERQSKLQMVPIGRPIANIQMYVLDSQLQPVPVGAAGELHIGGVGLARGYHNRPELTAEKFIHDPFSAEPGARLYKTGDLARYLPDGNIEYLGRLDHQVKIRGFRIELGEIESALRGHPGVKDAVVVMREDVPGDKRLVAYIVPNQRPVPTISEVRAHIKQALPEYMVPARFVMFDALPLSPNGKIDRKALPAPDQDRPELQDGYVAPQTEPEKMLAAIWSEVLDVQPIGIHDNFFELGGDSIRVIQILARAQQQGLNITLEQLFEQQTIHKLVQQLTTAKTASRPKRVEPFSMVSPKDRHRLPADLEDAYPMLKLQIGMIYHNELNPASAVFHDVFSFRINAQFVQEKLEAVLQQLGARHPNFRTSFNMAHFSEPLQLVHKTVSVPLTVEDFRPLPVEERTKAVVRWIEEEKRRPFDLARPPLLRFHVQRHNDESFQFFVSFSHLTLDGWSLAALVTEIFQGYSAALRGRGETPAPLSVDNRDYVALEQAALSSEECRRFWNDKLNGAEPQTLPRWPKSHRAGGADQVRGPEIQIPAEVFEGLKKLAQTAGVPLKSVLQTAHYRVLSFLHGSNDVSSGLVANGRPEEVDGARLLGLFLNIIPVRLQMNGGSWIDLARQTFAAERELIPHRRFPLAEIQAIHGNQTLIETDFDFVHWHAYRQLHELTGVGFAEGEYFEANNFVLSTTFILNIDSTKLEMHFDYDPEALARDQIEAMCGYYVNTLAAMVAQPTGRYDEFSPLSAAERQQLLMEWNATQSQFPKNECLHQLFEAQVERTPEAVAVVFEDKRLTYHELNNRVNQLALQLHDCGVGPDVLVGLCVERSLELVIGLLGILKAGGAYVPIDPTYPADRVAFMLEDANAPVVLTQKKWANTQAALKKAKLICLDGDAVGSEIQNPGFPVHAENLAYVLYTSGSTGKPKGAMIPHRAIVNHMRWMQSTFPLNERDCVLQKTPISFDASVWEFYAPLFAGGRLVVARPEGHRDAAYLVETINRHQVTILQLVPSLLRMLLETPAFKGCRSLRRVFCGGEALTGDLVRTFCKTLDAELHNLYGPTEVTIDSIFYSVQRDQLPEIVPIGRPVANTQAYILDNHRQPVPIGVPGELYLGGAQVGRGYHNRPGLTAEKFVPNPFSLELGARLYRTGDKVRYLADGNIEFLGRMDHQVKIRGYRIELGEIEAALRGHPKVKDAVVVVREDASANKLLLAYIVSRHHSVPAIEELRSHVKQALPDYMVPARFVVLDALPLTPNGKVDRKSLPAPEESGVIVTENFVAPRDATEQALANIWAAVLKVKRVSIHDNFFELGGHSLLAVRLFAQIKKLTGKELPLVTLFQAPTIAQLAAILHQEGWETPWASLVPIKPAGSKPPFYCVHGVGGNILEYLDLAKYMDEDQPFYGLQAIGLDGKRPIENLTVEQMAARYIQEIRTFQASGPYYLGGSSFGGLVAYEMAQQLRAAGEEVGLLAFFDTNAPGYPQLLPTTTAWQQKWNWWRDRVSLHWGNLRAGSRREKLTYTREKAQRWKKQLRWKRQHLWDRIREQVGRVFWPAAIKQARVVGYRAGTSYEPKSYPGRVTLFRATEQPRGIDPDRTLGWGGLVKGGLKIYNTPGHHGAIVRKPRSRVLAQQLTEALHDAEAKATAPQARASTCDEVLLEKAHASGNGNGSTVQVTENSSSSQILSDLTNTAAPVVSVPADGAVLPTSFAQQRLWLLDQIDPNNAVYNIPLALRLWGQLNLEALRAALQTILQRHEPLRSTFGMRDWQPVQIVAKSCEVEMPLVEFSTLPEERREAEARRWCVQEAQRPFDLMHDLMLRASLLRLGPTEHILFLNMHHIASDGWSITVLSRELGVLYEAFSNGQPSPLPALPIQYADFAVWQREWLRGAELGNQLRYWRQQMDGASGMIELRTDRARPAAQSYRGAVVTRALPAPLSLALADLSRQEGATLFMTLLAAFQTLLYRYSGQEDIVVGSPIAGRNQTEIEGLIGFFVNILALRSNLSGNPSFRTLLGRTREVAFAAYAHEDLPFEKLVEELQPQRDLSRPPFFQVTFAFQNVPMQAMELVGLTVTPIPIHNGTAKFDLSLYVREGAEGLEAEVEYCTDLFDAETIARLLGHYEALLEGIVANPDERIGQLPLLKAVERQQVLLQRNDTKADYSRESCVHQLFEAQAAKTPDAPALVFEEQQLSYRELNRRANQLAHHLQSLGAGPEKRVAICVERSAEMIVGLLGILKSGAAYVALDPVFPAERLAYMIEDSQAMLVVTQQKLAANRPGVRRVNLDEFDWSTRNADDNPQSGVAAKNLVYVIYTSGSTGRPKGVAIEHRQLVNYVQGILRRMDFPAGANFATVSTIAADLGNTVVFPALCNGGCLHIISQDRAADAAAFAEYCERHHIDCLKIVPSHLAALLSTPNAKQVMPRQRLILGGEASRCEWVATLQKLAPECVIFNHYGPTETTVGVLTYRVGEQLPLTASGTVPLGSPLANSQIYILDERMQPVPVGVPGELCIGGDGVARGYLNRPELTAERFVPDPFSSVPGARLYRTGDQARYLVDGNIEFLGRIDQQVKIRGFRIELGEIETAISQQPGVREAVVVAREDQPGNKQLVAYVVPRQSVKVSLNGGGKPYKLPNNLLIAHLNKNETDYIYKEIFEVQAYLRHGITIKDGDVVFDVGMNIGLFTVFVNQICQRPKVYAFEPNPIVHAIAQANAAAHGADVKVFQCGLSDKTTTADLTFFEGFSLLSGFHSDVEKEKEVVRNYMINQQKLGQGDMAELIANADELLEDRFKARTFKAQLRTLSSVIADEKISRIDMLKVNVEKSELQVLQGIRDKDWRKIQQIVLEVDVKENLDTIIVLLEKHGFEYVVEQDMLLEKTELCYIYAIRPSAERRLIREQAPSAHVRQLPVVSDTAPSLNDLQRDLRQRLPDYMVPARFVMLDALPLTPNGKIDRKALPVPDENRTATSENFVAPHNSLEQALANIWAEVLKVKRVGVYDNFFDLGGHSLLATQVISRIRTTLHTEVSVRNLFESPTVAGLIAMIGKNGNGNGKLPIRPTIARVTGDTRIASLGICFRRTK